MFSDMLVVLSDVSPKGGEVFVNFVFSEKKNIPV